MADYNGSNLEGLKMLNIESAYFALPSDFCGNKLDAFKLFAEYFIEHYTQSTSHEPSDCEHPLFNIFLSLSPFDKQRCAWGMGVQQLVNGVWGNVEDSE